MDILLERKKGEVVRDARLEIWKSQVQALL